jgi:hypothetical protein
MQKLPRFTAPVMIAFIAICSLLLRNTARAWQDDQDASKLPITSNSATATEPPPVADPEATQLVRTARDRLSQWQSVRARLVERVDIAERRFKASGTYVAGEFPKTRIEYEVAVGGTVGTVLEVCDGQVLHILRGIKQDGEKASDSTPAAKEESKSKQTMEAVRRDVQQILRASPGAQGATLPLRAGDLGMGGLPAILASLERSMVFESVKDEEHDGQKFRIVQGRWKPEYLSSLLAKMGGAAQQVAGFIPDRVRIDFDAESLFPVRFMYLKLASAERKSYRPLVTLEFHDVEFDTPLPPDTFAYQLPAGVDEMDGTATFLEMLKGPQVQVGSPAGRTVTPRSSR